MLKSFRGVQPGVAASAFIEETAVVIGDVEIGEESSVWFHSVLRGDMHFIRVGNRTNIQDLSMLHVRHGEAPVLLGDDVTVGHRVVLHGCTIRDRVIVGMGSIVMDDAEVGEDSIIGAGSLVTPGTVVPPRSLALGSPARIKRSVTRDELVWIRDSARRYVEFSRHYIRAAIMDHE